MKIIERVLKRKLQQLVIIDALQFGLMPSRGIIDLLFVVRTMQEEDKINDNGCTCVEWMLIKHLIEFKEKI